LESTTAVETPVTRQLAEGVVIGCRWWVRAHRDLVRSMTRTGTSPGWVGKLAVCAAVDVAAAAAALFIAAMAVAPVLGI
jgi:hypothetical protein